MDIDGWITRADQSSINQPIMQDKDVSVSHT